MYIEVKVKVLFVLITMKVFSKDLSIARAGVFREDGAGGGVELPRVAPLQRRQSTRRQHQRPRQPDTQLQPAPGRTRPRPRTTPTRRPTP